MGRLDRVVTEFAARLANVALAALLTVADAATQLTGRTQP
jgi:hypothetical protein